MSALVKGIYVRKLKILCVNKTCQTYITGTTHTISDLAYWECLNVKFYNNNKHNLYRYSIKFFSEILNIFVILKDVYKLCPISNNLVHLTDSVSLLKYLHLLNLLCWK